MKGNLLSSCENYLKYPLNEILCLNLKYIFSIYPVSQLVERIYILCGNVCAHIHTPLLHIFFLNCPWSAAPTNCIVKGDRRWQETARFFLLEIAPFGTPKARLKNIPRPKIVVQRATLSTVLDDDAVWRWQVSLAPVERLTLPPIVLQRLLFSSLIRCFSNLSYRNPQKMHFTRRLCT